MEIEVGMTRSGLRKLADRILAECDTHHDDQGIEVLIVAEHNGRGPSLTIRLSNEDMEGDHIPSPDSAYWEEA